MPTSIAPNTGLIRLPEVLKTTGLGRSTVWAWVKQNRFPTPIKLSHRVVAWRVADVQNWVDAKEKAAQQ